MPKQTIYTVGGTVQAGGGLYIKRKADDELLELCRQGEFAFILSSRQVGKSSLMVRTAQQLEKENIRSVTVDLSAIGVNISADEWYLGIMNEIHTALDLETDLFVWWNQYAQLGPAQRLTNFFKDILLKEVKEQIVLFFDEIDSTLSIPFSDDFYVAIRSVYNARSTNPDFKRLSFVLVGVATPADLISDNKRTPFNIGRRVEINDFTLAEALPLAEGLGEQAVQALTWVFQYTGGHPYLTQRLCAYLANLKEPLGEHVVATAVERLFTGEQGKQDNNLQFVRDMLSARSPDVTGVLKIYKDIRAGKQVTDDERSLTKSHLKLSGLVRSEKGLLKVRNEIYNSVFDLQWIRENTPKNWQRVALISVSAVLGILILGSLAIFINDYFVSSRRDQHFRSFISSSLPEQRLSDLAEIYKREGIFSYKDSDLMGAQLFYGLSTAEDQLALFRIYDVRDKPELQSDLVVVISHLYTTVADVDPEMDNTRLLQAMLDAVVHVEDDPVADRLKNELNAWIAARKDVANQDYVGAAANYTTALSLNPSNHAVLYERAKANVALKLYTNALKDLNDALAAAKQSAPDIATAAPTSSGTATDVTPSAEVQTAGPTSETGITPLGLTSRPTELDRTATAEITPSLDVTVTPTPTLTAVPTYVLPPKYKSNFTTLIEIVNAVQGLIQDTPQLQIAMQSNGQDEYANLESFGLVLVIPVTPSPDLETQALPVTLPVDTDRALGIDVSFFNGEIDWAQVKNAGIDFAFIKATESDFYSDPTFEANWTGAKSAGILTGAYLFFRANADPVQQAERFVNEVSLASEDLPPVLDLETFDGQDKESFQAALQAVLTELEVGTGRKPIIYTTNENNFMETYLTDQAGNYPDWLMQYPLWYAEFPESEFDVELDAPLLPNTWTGDWLFWQYTQNGRINGINGRVDLNVFNGSVEDLQAFIQSSNVDVGSAEQQFQATDQVIELPSGFELIQYYQNDPRWKNEKLGFSNETLGGWGTLVTCFAMVLHGYGYDETPVTVNEKMKDAGGYQGALLIPSVLPSVYPNFAYEDMVSSDSKSPPLDQIHEYVTAGQPVILQVDWNEQAGIQSHFVVAYAHVDDDYLILDPYLYEGESPGQEVRLTERYNFNGGTLEQEISAAIFFK